MFTDVGFHLNSGFTKILCTPIFPLFDPNTTVIATNTTAVFVSIDLFISKYLFGNVNLELSVIMLSHTVEGGHLHRLIPNVNSETAKYTSPRKLDLVYLAVSSLPLG